LGYSRESTIAEKVQAMIYLGEMNSRMKDFYDVWSLATHFDFDGLTLAQAIHETCKWRQTPLSSNLVAFSDHFTRDEERQAQWKAFIRRLHLEDAPNTLHEVVKTIAAFIQPAIQALAEGGHFDQRWPPGGPWMEYVG
jgi:biotin carboxylase